MKEHFTASYPATSNEAALTDADGLTPTRNAGRRRAQGMLQHSEQEAALRQADPIYDARVGQSEADTKARAEQKATETATQAELLSSLPGSPEQYDEKFGPGTALALAKGEVSWAELNETPYFTHASTGEQMSKADAEELLADAAEQNAEVLRAGRLLSKATHIADGIRKLKENPVHKNPVHTETVHTEQGPLIIEAIQLDQDHSVEAAFSSSGELADIRVIASEISPDGTIREHSVEVDIDTTHPEDPQSLLKIDGMPATPEESEIAEAVVEHTVEGLDAKVSLKVETAETVESEPQPKVVEPKSEASKQESSRSPEKIDPRHQFIGETARYFRPGAHEKVLQQVAEEAGIDLADFRERLGRGEIAFDKESYEALKELKRNGLKPGSPEWSTDPRNSSTLGVVARESRQLLATLLRQASR